jgi:hypothetical protein
MLVSVAKALIYTVSDTLKKGQASMLLPLQHWP